ncbi:MAG: hypothetical protein ABL999_12295 [Pyrinomonadaceae bacterium]
MPSVETIYQESIRPLPIGDQVRLAEMIMERTANPRQDHDRRSVLEILESIHAKTPGRTAAEIDEYIKTERDSWDD